MSLLSSYNNMKEKSSQLIKDDTQSVLITLFVACYNEEARIVPTLETIHKAYVKLGCSYEVIIIDDCSTDQSNLRVKEYLSLNPDFPAQLYKNKVNLGLARSYVETAFRGRGEYYRLVCGDNPEGIETMILLNTQIGKADIIAPYYEQLPGKSFPRVMISKLFTAIVNFITGNKIYYYNGCGIYRRYDVMRWAPHSFGFGFQADLMTRLLDENRTVHQIPVQANHVDKEAQNSALNLRNFLSVTHSLLEILIRRIRAALYTKKI